MIMNPFPPISQTLKRIQIPLIQNGDGLEKRKIAKVRVVKVFHAAEIRNQWVDWYGTTDVITTHLSRIFFSIDEARNTIEEWRTPGSGFQIKELAALMFIGASSSLIVADSNYGRPYKSASDQVEGRLRGALTFKDVYDSIPKANFLKFHFVKDTCESINDLLNEEQLFIHRSKSGGKRHGLAWIIRPYNVNIIDLIKFSANFNANLAQPTEPENQITVVSSSAAITAKTEPGFVSTEESQPLVDEQVLSDKENSTENLSLSSSQLDNPESELEATERVQETKGRIGQEIFRARVEEIEPFCRVTKTANGEHLRASHIKPWSKSNNAEKLDGNNGLMLAPHIDHLFDGGYISFNQNGDILVSEMMDRAVLAVWGISLQLNVGKFSDEQERYLYFHRDHILKRRGGQP